MNRPAANDVHDAMLNMRMLIEAFQVLADGPRQDGDAPGWLWSVRRVWDGVESAWEALEAAESEASVSTGPRASDNGYFQKLAVVEPGKVID